MIKLKRVYEKPSEQDGVRVLVERLWPRGLTKQDAEVHLWLKEIAPSAELRKWFGHEPGKWKEFQSRYKAELEAKAEEVLKLKQMAVNETVTLVFAARNERLNSALVLKSVLES